MSTFSVNDLFPVHRSALGQIFFISWFTGIFFQT